MKLLFTTLLFVSLASVTQAQMTVFERNQEIARYNQSKQISRIVSDAFIPQGTVTQSQYVSICALMGEKDGYVSCLLTPQNELIIQHENTVQVKDIADVIKNVIPVDPKKEIEAMESKAKK